MTCHLEPALTHRRTLTGFSLIEILVVIGLIALLSTLLLIGIGKLQTNSRRQATRLAFQNLQAMYSEWDASNRHHFLNYQDTNTGLYPVDVSAPSPGDVTTSGADRQGTAVLATRDIMALMKQMPTNAAAMGKLSASAFTTLPAAPIAAAPWNSNTYPIYTRVYVQQQATAANPFPMNYFYTAVAINWSTSPLSSTAPQPSPPNSQFWIASSADATVPVLLDGWGNPIIFVPGGVLGDGAMPADTGSLIAGGNSTTAKSPDGRPFWASAGPDGNFSTGDDNLYSFEK
jgi:type II secretory pathway pseudopilin PulG